jgi:chaperonin GroES
MSHEKSEPGRVAPEIPHPIRPGSDRKKRHSLTLTNQFTNVKEELVMKDINLKPLDDRVVVEPVEAEEVTAGGIVLPDTAKEKPQRGTVLAVGPGKLLDNGQRGKLSVAVGDEVIYGKYSGSEVEVDGREVKILRESDILAKVVK